MIVLREINIDEYMKANSILKEEGIEDDLSKGIVYILIDNEEYLLSKGFEYNNNKFKDSYKLYLKIDDFFKKKSCGDKDEL